MIKKLTLLLFASSFCGSLAAQTTPSVWVGTWKVNWPNAQGRVQEAKMVVTEGGAGTWQTYTRAMDNPCVGREVPIHVEQATGTDARIQLKFADTISGCSNSTVELKAGDSKTATGTRGKLALTLEKR